MTASSLPIFRCRLSDKGERGAIFVESLVASAIVAMIMMAMFRVVSDAAAHTRMNEQRRVAVMIAQSELADVGADIPIAPGETSGSQGDFAWTVDISSFSDESGASSVGALWSVSVSVRPRWGGRSLVRLHTLRLGPEA